ncbi:MULTISPECIES: zinc-binding dehydrogenase [unclassified Arcicella]|uniref:zinc-dependent alcohol dehydrogenase n=1 Tax=unclassified Arcicella TaxID=2644986 RepID=UPI00285714CE|nr:MULTISPECIES: alcohol dehydrogenase catalytic domain-containing protein [unclassified Arcicella]MDR6562273.1 2-desacetyl-2-hydroxyethyl bacteriochlorophyllide A dehydrogenase [Arcicella sp. BE51]MDR6812033.1 2-desacetyl-2-hydroxyethyl bacteriochlorophyllide A dehydrogenase [Arcicella sp. BE140]MDR6823344.1 2-desacetyl-2-hydroxyethyl bacteriochlorophyllide A dehydrogenase [Arcicella sp. BE139]
MTALFYEGNHSFNLKNTEPIPLGKGEVRLKMAFVGVCGTDVHIYHGKMDARVKPPQIIGHEVSGIIDALGEGVTDWEVGEKVTVRPLNPGEEVPADNGFRHIGQNLKFIGIDSAGGMQTYWNVPAFTLHRLPENLSLSLGALIEPLAVACHDVRLGELKAGENAVIIGGGPIGLLIALVAKHKGANVLISEVNPNRISFIQSLGFETVNPIEQDLVKTVEDFTDGAMADVVFEVSGVQAGVTAMTQIPRVRGRIVMVAIHAEPKTVDLFRFFWREIKMVGARVYEPEDFDEAIALAAGGTLPLEKMITQISPLEDAQQVFEMIDQNPAGMKYLLEI